jgi:hypothetical protein
VDFHNWDFAAWISVAGDLRRGLLVWFWWNFVSLKFSLRDLGFYALGFCDLDIVRSEDPMAWHSTALETNKLANSQPRCNPTSRGAPGQ